MDRRALTIAGASILLLASSVPFLIQIEDPYEGKGLRSALLQLRGVHAALTSDVLELRLGLESNYDALAARQRELEKRSAEFAAQIATLDEPDRTRLDAVFAPFVTEMEERHRVIERFPVDNATLNNSLRLLGATHARARANFEARGLASSALQERLEQVARDTSRYFVYPEDGLRDSLRAELSAPWTVDGGVTGPAAAMLGHARIVVQQKDLVDAHVRRLVETSGETALLETFAVLEEEARASAARAVTLRALVSSSCVLTVVITCTAGAWTALRQNAALEREVSERIRVDAEASKLENELRQAQKLESIGQLASGIAHEINTPIQFVSDSVHFVRDAVRDLTGLVQGYQGLQGAVVSGTATPAEAEALATAAVEADLEYLLDNLPDAIERSLEGLERVATIVRSLKDFAHPEQKEMSPADLNQAIQSTLVIARNEYKYVADVVTEFGELPLVTCHLGRINQVVLNILVNAAHAIGDKVRGSEAKGRITLRTFVEEDHAVIAIGDTGGGIPPGIRERIFDPFFTTKEVGRGTGQGLAISRSVVVEKHGGSLTFESEMGVGTTFFVRLPLEGPRQKRASELEAAA